MNQALIYSLKLWSTCIIGTPLVFITYIHLLPILPAYQVTLDDYSYLLMFTFSTVSVAGIWFYKFKLSYPMDENFPNL